ncbi:hypothetical protein N7539_001389 [Penicillium diatomitis]|uniref:nicotinamidase n=1 Tax=Penicillium diatomitis TaxID=2819901 RepID=A0A9W9XGX3_9EURO|nr:uncharacterized protein N7539_001389 [Penicillium diatomitis]KAJ5492643.1 hypothetical protein N7539_001389 [Penicillium diatomitis]
MEFRGSDRGPFVPALIVVDMQEDFCPPEGSLAVREGRDIAPVINTLLAQPGLVVRIATQDWHPANHISFASNHPPPNNRPFESFAEMKNPAPDKKMESMSVQLWPDHCVANTTGSNMIPEIDTTPIDHFIRKGTDPQVEMYSAFGDAFGNLDPAVTSQSGVTDVIVVGLAGDYCVKWTAIDAVKAGFRSWLVEEGTRCVAPEGWDKVKAELHGAGVSVVHMDDPIVKKLSTAVD